MKPNDHSDASARALAAYTAARSALMRMRRSEARIKMELEMKLSYIVELMRQDKEYGAKTNGFHLRSIRIILEKLGKRKIEKSLDIYGWPSYLMELRSVMLRQRDEDRNRYHRHYRERRALEERYRASKKA